MYLVDPRCLLSASLELGPGDIDKKAQPLLLMLPALTGERGCMGVHLVCKAFPLGDLGVQHGSSEEGALNRRGHLSQL